MDTYLPLEARLALEWLCAGGQRTPERLKSLVEHYCETNAVQERETRDAIYQVAAERAAIFRWF